MVISNCALCAEPVHENYPTQGRDGYWYQCDRCGEVKVSRFFATDLRKPIHGKLHLLSGFNRQRTESGHEPIEILTTNATDLISGSNVPTTVPQKVDHLLGVLAQKTEFGGQGIPLRPEVDYPLAYAKNREEFNFLIQQLVSFGLVESNPGQGGQPLAVTLTVAGWSKLGESNKKGARTQQAFVAMWFTEQTQHAYDLGIDKAIREAGFIPLRVDRLEHNEKICDRIVSEIRRSAFLVADFTGHRGGVYFEAGYALGLGIPVIWLCRADEIEKAHFDTRQFNHILWENDADLYEKLLSRITATITKSQDRE